jgi:pimeloyl-ACP methyl ester carboxylesterase
MVYEWGDETDPPLFLVHGGFDFARTFEVFAPLLVAAGYRAISWDHRGHGQSDQTELYSWDADIRDAAMVMDSITDRPAPVVAHSKGGAMMAQLADAQPFRFSHLVNIDGVPFRRPGPDIPEHERSRMMSTDVARWLDHRRKVATASRPPGTVEDLARRRGRMNPRLSQEWLEHLVAVGARHDEDGWRWTIDPSLRFGGFGPWRPEWTAMRLAGLSMPLLLIFCSEAEEMGWGTQPHHIAQFLPPGARTEMVQGVGHFVHIEQPDLVASMVLEFLATHP